MTSPIIVWADSNVLIRIITGDPPKMAEEVKELTRKVDQNQVVLKIASIVMAECCWVLESLYGYNPPDIARALTNIINAKGMDGEEKPIVLAALRDYDQQHVDYIDAYIAVKVRASIRTSSPGTKSTLAVLGYNIKCRTKCSFPISQRYEGERP